MLNRAARLAIATQKGGGGKSTLLVSVAAAALQAGRRVSIVDTDPQGTASYWGQLRKKAVNAAPITVIQCKAQHLEKVIAALEANGCDFVIIDTPGTDSPDVDAVLRIADLTIVPVQPRLPDLHAARVTYAKGCQLSRACFHLLTRVPAQGNRLAQAHAFLAQLSARWLTALLGDRVDHEEAFKRGLGVTEHNPTGAAAREIAAVWAAIEPYL